jgi:CBS domain-containing protein
MQSLLVRDVMTSPVLTIRPHTRLPTIKRMMREQQVHRLPVVEGGRLLGIITLGDVRNAFPSDLLLLNSAPQVRLDDVRADTLMRTEVVTTTPDAPLTTAVALLLRHKISGLPVLTGPQLVGILTKSDICRAVLQGALLVTPLTLQTARPERETFPYPMTAMNSTVVVDGA